MVEVTHEIVSFQSSDCTLAVSGNSTAAIELAKSESDHQGQT